MTSPKHFDAIIVGGSYAGLSAAMALGRSLRKVLVIDSGKPCNAPTPHSHNFLTQDGRTPAEISKLAREQVSRYDTVSFVDQETVVARNAGQGFEVVVGSGEVFYGRKVILATGIKDQLPDIPGLAECWGKSVIHCPYCHGYEFRGKKTAILANGEPAMHYAMLIGNLTKDLTVLSNGKADFTDDQHAKLSQHRIAIIESGIARIDHDAGQVRKVVFDGKSEKAFDAVYFKPPFVQHEIATSLGCALNEQGYIVVDAFQKTTVEGVYACGDNSSGMRAVANAVGTGNLVGAVVNKELTAEQF